MQSDACVPRIRRCKFRRAPTLTGSADSASRCLTRNAGRANDVFTVDDSHVQELISNAEQEFDARSLGIEPGSFVRIVNGESKDLCGHCS